MKSNSFIFLIVAALISTAFAGFCHKKFTVKKDDPAHVAAVDGMCKFAIIGDTGCNVKLNCKLDLPGKTGGCNDTYIKVTDAGKGAAKYCGKTVLKDIQPSIAALKDLFLDASSSKSKNWSCTASCAGKGSMNGRATSLIHNSEEEEDVVTWERDERRSTETCRTGFPVHKGSSNTTFSSKDKACKIDVIGVGCRVSLSCDIDIPGKPGSCDDSLKISDGFGGYGEYCGKTSIKVQTHSSDYRDLFIDASEISEGTWSCKAVCDVADSTRLPKASTTKEDFRCVCGLQNKDDRIVGGEDAKFNEFPWQTAVVFSGTRSPICGSALLNERYILTAAHCFYMENVKNTDIEVLVHAYLLDATQQDNARDVALGEEGSIRGAGYNRKSVSDKDENTLRFKVSEIIMHPLFNDRYDYDYALLRLEKKVDLFSADSPTPICLPEAGKDMYNRSYDGAKPWVVGWGKPHELAGSTTRLLQKLEVPIVPLKKCIDWVGDVVTQRMICAGYEKGGRDACTGDSGGPLILKKPNKQWEQIGVVSWGEGCARPKSPGFYARVTENLQWIRHHASTGGAKWCRTKKD